MIMNKKRTFMILGGVLGLAALCCVGVVIFGYFYNEGSLGETRNLADLKAVCGGDVVAETAVYNPNTPGTHPTAILQYLGGSEYIFVSTNWGYHPNSLEEAELVVCLENVEETVTETCEYTLEEGAGEATITRVSRVADYKLITAQTGEMLAEGSVKANPRQCQDQETFENNASFTVRGDFGEALEPLIETYIVVR
jgi:hypothetical protein